MRIFTDKPSFPSEKGIIFISGVSGNALSDRFDAISKDFADAGFYFLRFEGWTSPEELHEMSIKKIFSEIDEMVKVLEGLGCKKIGLLGKSFGGGIALTYSNSSVVADVLWSPAFEISKISTFESHFTTRLNEIGSARIQISEDFLSRINIPVAIFHGSKDERVSVKNSKKLAWLILNSELFVIEGADHSFTDKKSDEFFRANAVKFFQKKMEVKSHF